MDPVFGGAALTPRSLAGELGISVKEAVALCTVSGTPVRSPDTPLTEEQAARARAVLEGQVPMVVKPPASKASRSLVLALAVGGAVLVVGILGVVALGSVINQEASITVSPGQCFNAPGVFSAQLKAVPCSEPHEYRAEAVLDLREVYGDEYPGWDELTRRAEERCRALGVGDENATFTEVQFYFFGPDNQRVWDDPAARKIVCAVPAD